MKKSLFKSTKNYEKMRMEKGDGKTFNLTHLGVLGELKRFRFEHRDYLAHAFRYLFTVEFWRKNFRKGECSILDVGCGPEWNQAVALWSNRCHPREYVGVDARDCLKNMPKTCFPIRFIQANVVKRLPSCESGKWDLIVCYEVLEHMPKTDGEAFFEEIQEATGLNTTVLLSTPCYNHKTMAENHIYEWEYRELKEQIKKLFDIKDHFGTFASIRDYADLMSREEKTTYERLKKYYNSGVMACIMAPLYPHKSRNVLWVLKKKTGNSLFNKGD